MYVKTLNGLSLNGAWKMQLMLYGCWVLGFALAWLLAGNDLLQYPSLLLSVFLASGVTMIVYALVRLKDNFTLVPKINISVDTFLLAFSMALALVVVKDALAYVQPLPAWPELSFTSIHTGSLYAIVVSVMLSAFMEELLFRGIVMEALLQRYSGGVALLQSSLLFMLAHPDPAQMPGALLLGLLAGYFYLRLRDLCSCFLIHLVHNAATAVIALSGGSLQFAVTDPYTYSGLVLGCALALAAGYFLLRSITPGSTVKRPVLFAK
ncbi:CPBP family intramembrane glutamic endopeptidase [Chitinophaga alhagiae]|nr:type II CAAX endopeptidase family protein [Chitinophaga alhagiae]